MKSAELATETHPAKTAADVMTVDPVVVHDGDVLELALEQMARYAIRHLPVVAADGSPLGMLSDRDLHWSATSLAEVSIGSVMTSAPIAVAPETPLEEVASALAEERVGAVPVIDHGRLVGIVSNVDMLRAWPRPEPIAEHVDGIQLELSTDEARFLISHLKAHLAAVEDELVHTEQRGLQRELAADVDRLRVLIEKMERRQISSKA